MTVRFTSIDAGYSFVSMYGMSDEVRNGSRPPGACTGHHHSLLRVVRDNPFTRRSLDERSIRRSARGGRRIDPRGRFFSASHPDGE